MVTPLQIKTRSFWPLHQILTILLAFACFSILNTLGDELLHGFLEPGVPFRSTIFARLFAYAFIYLGLFCASGWIVPLVLIEFFFRLKRFPFWIYQVLVFLFAGLLAYRSVEDHYSFYIHEGRDIKYDAALLLTGLLYPYIADLIFRRLENIQLNYRRKQKEKAGAKPDNTPGNVTGQG